MDDQQGGKQMSRGWRLLRRRRFMGWFGAMVAASLALMLLGSGDALAATPTHAVDVQVLADHNVADLDTLTNTFVESIPGPAARKMQTTRKNTIDQTQWHVTTRLVDGDIPTNGADYRSEWSTTTSDDGLRIDLLVFNDGGMSTVTQLIDTTRIISARSMIEFGAQAAMPRNVRLDLLE